MNSIKFLIRVQALMDVLCDRKDKDGNELGCSQCPLSGLPYDCDKWDSDVLRLDEIAWANWNIEAVGCTRKLPLYTGGKAPYV